MVWGATVITEAEFLGFMHVKLHIAGSQKLLADLWGISESYLSDVLTGRRQPGEKICRAMGYERVVMYREIEELEIHP